MKPLILVTNDDGIHSEGLAALAEALSEVGEVTVCAPDREQSAVSHSLTLHKPLRINKIRERFYAIEGTPTDCVYLATRSLMKGDGRPALVASGINKGSNLGDDIHYSGTVSAAFEGTVLGIPSMAVSVVGRGPHHFETAAAFAAKLARRMLEEKLPGDTLLNVNVPNVAPEDVKGVEVTKMGKRHYGDSVVERTDPRGRRYYWIGGSELDAEDIENSDCNALVAGKISVTPLHLDLTNHVAMKRITGWNL
jgi:5'-nucleotidase